MSLSNKNIIITGATSGFGMAFAALLSKEGANVFIGGRRADEIVYDMTDYSRSGNTTAFDANPNCKVGWCLTRDRWLQVLAFAHKVKARIVFTLNYDVSFVFQFVFVRSMI